MKYPILLTMSLLSLLFGCNTKKTPPKPEEYPRFPETDNPTTKVDIIHLDDGYWTKCFYISADKQSIYVLGYGKIVSTTMQDGEETRPDLRDQANYRLFCLDTKGQIKQRLNLPTGDTYASARFGEVDGQLMLWFNEWFLVLDTRKFAVVEKIPIYSENDFPTKQEIELMTPNERWDAYEQKMEAALAKPATGKWLKWLSGGGDFFFAKSAAGKHSAWAPIDEDDRGTAVLKSRFDSITVPINPQCNNFENGENFQCTDGPAQIRETDYISGGAELNYPNYVGRMIVQYEMIVGQKTLHFSTTDKGRHKRRLDFSDNLMLATADGAAWVKYEADLYRIE